MSRGKEEPIKIGVLAPARLLSTETADIFAMAPSKTDVLRWAAGLDPDVVIPTTAEERRMQTRKRIGRSGLKFEFTIGQ